MKKYSVTLDPSKCVSYTLPDGRKFLPGRTRMMEEGEFGPFQDAGVFLIHLAAGDTPAEDKAKQAAGFKRKKPITPEVNHEEKIDGEETKEERSEE